MLSTAGCAGSARLFLFSFGPHRFSGFASTGPATSRIGTGNDEVTSSNVMTDLTNPNICDPFWRTRSKLSRIYSALRPAEDDFFFRFPLAHMYR